ncbi:hypothetical protein VXJ15_002495 [Vibrio vulnificus]|nr:hypothetical protein [Vibrio vulnificus]
MYRYTSHRYSMRLLCSLLLACIALFTIGSPPFCTPPSSPVIESKACSHQGHPLFMGLDSVSLFLTLTEYGTATVWRLR